LLSGDKILFEAKAVEKLTDSHIKQVLNYLAASKLRIGLLVNFGGDVLEWKRIILYDADCPDCGGKDRNYANDHEVVQGRLRSEP
jgi:hypothetical protein